MIEKSLIIVMPVYNEEGAIGTVLDKWVAKLDSMPDLGSYEIHAYNDGSRDHTAEILAGCAARHEGKVVVHNKVNSGHGPTILQGYRENADRAEWLFQIDSDDEMTPDCFDQLWEKREENDFLIGIRDGRKQALPRKVISFVSRLSVRIFYGKSVWDVNSPYRLMRSSVFREIYAAIPADTFAPNVIISGMAARNGFRCYEMPVPQRDRQTGEVSIKKWKLLKAAMKSFRQTILFSFADRAGFNTKLLLFAMLFSVIFLGMSSRNSPLYVLNEHVDINAYFTMGKGILADKIPYLDLFDHKGAVLYFLFAFAAWISSSTMTGVFVLEVIAMTLFLYFSGKIFHLFVNSENKTLLAIPVLMFLVTSSASFVGGSVEELVLWLMVWPLYAVLKRLKNGKMLRNRDLLVCGSCFSLVFWMKYSLCGFFFGLVLFFAYWYIRSGKWKKLFSAALIFLLPFMVVSGGIIWWFAAKNALKELFNVYFYINIFQYGFKEESMSMLEKFVRNISNMVCDDEFFFPLLLLGAIWTISRFVMASKNSGSERLKLINYGILCCLTVIFLWIGEFSAIYFYYYSSILAVYVVFGLILFDSVLSKWGVYRGIFKSPRKFDVLALILVCILIVSGSFVKGRFRARKNPREHYVQFRMAEIVRKYDNPRVLNYNLMDCGFYMATGMVPQHRIFAVLNINSAEMLAEQQRYILDGSCDFVMVHRRPRQELDIFQKHYQVVLRDGDWLLFQKKDLKMPESAK